jgi:hypothetical protein
MKRRLLELVSLTATVAGLTAILYVIPQPAGVRVSAAEPATAKTPWGDPDLQGIWTVERLVPLERPNGASKAFYTDEEVAKLDRERSGKSVFGNGVREERGSEADVAGAYNSVFTSQRRTGRRTGMITDPPDGKIPPMTPQALERQATFRTYQQALIQNTNACKNGLPGCTYGPPSPLLAQQPPMYTTANLNRADGPEDRSLGERRMSGGMPDFRGGFTGIHRAIVQTQGAMSVLFDTGQGQAFTRMIPINNTPHAPSSVRQWWGDSRAHWEGTTLVVDVTNFSPKSDFQGARENLHLVERWRRTGPKTLEIETVLEDSTTWTRPWTVIQEFDLQSAQENKIYAEPRCHEGNFGLAGLLMGARTAEKAHAEGKGPHPATLCIAACAGPSEEDRDPLALR